MLLKIGVMFGGESVEHEISIITALQAMAAISKDRYEVIPIYVSKERLFYSGKELLEIGSYRDLKQLVKKIPQVTFYRTPKEVIMTEVKKRLFQSVSQSIDVILPIMHGTNGEDGRLQGYLETLKIPYGFCDVLGAAVGQDKVVMKQILAHEKLPVCPWFWFYSSQLDENPEDVLEKAATLGYPLVLKPANLGSSVGIQIVYSGDHFLHAATECAQYDQKILVEQKINDLKEINAAVLGNSSKQRVSVLEEVGHTDEILSYKDKYLGTNGKQSSKGMASLSRIIPANLDETLTAHIQALAKSTFQALGSSGICRIDFMIDMSTNAIYVNEINTIPGSLAFYLWDKSDVTFPQLMEEIIHLAIDRHRQKEKMIFSYDTNILNQVRLNGTKGIKY